MGTNDKLIDTLTGLHHVASSSFQHNLSLHHPRGNEHVHLQKARIGESQRKVSIIVNSSLNLDITSRNQEIRRGKTPEKRIEALNKFV